MEENNCNRGAQSRLPLVGPGDQNLIRKETLAAGRFAPGLQAHSSMRKCWKPSANQCVDILDPCNHRKGLPRQFALAEVAPFAKRLKILDDCLAAQCDGCDVISVENDI